MKRSFMILLASMLLVFSLTACGRNDSNNAQTSDDPPTTNQEANTNGQSNGGQSNSGTQDDAIMGGDSQNGEPGGQNGSTGSENGSTGNQEDSMMNESTTGSAEDQNVGVSYEKMLRNGRVHDTDGLLNDGENSVSGTTGSVKDAAKDVVRSTRNTVNNMTR